MPVNNILLNTMKRAAFERKLASISRGSTKTARLGTLAKVLGLGSVGLGLGGATVASAPAVGTMIGHGVDSIVPDRGPAFTPTSNTAELQLPNIKNIIGNTLRYPKASVNPEYTRGSRTPHAPRGEGKLPAPIEDYGDGAYYHAPSNTYREGTNFGGQTGRQIDLDALPTQSRFISDDDLGFNQQAAGATSRLSELMRRAPRYTPRSFVPRTPYYEDEVAPQQRFNRPAAAGNRGDGAAFLAKMRARMAADRAELENRTQGLQSGQTRNFSRGVPQRYMPTPDEEYSDDLRRRYSGILEELGSNNFDPISDPLFSR